MRRLIVNAIKIETHNHISKPEAISITRPAIYVCVHVRIQGVIIQYNTHYIS